MIQDRFNCQESLYARSWSQEEVKLFRLRQEPMSKNRMSLTGNIYDGTLLIKVFYQNTTNIRRRLSPRDLNTQA